MKNRIFARFARAFFLYWHFVDVLVLSTTWNELFFSCVDDVIWWQMFNFVFLCPKRWFQFNSWIVRTQFSSIMSLNYWNMIAETRGHMSIWRSRFRRRRVCLSSYWWLWRELPLKNPAQSKMETLEGPVVAFKSEARSGGENWVPQFFW